MFPSSGDPRLEYFGPSVLTVSEEQIFVADKPLQIHVFDANSLELQRTHSACSVMPSPTAAMLDIVRYDDARRELYGAGISTETRRPLLFRWSVDASCPAKIVDLPEIPWYVGNDLVGVGETVAAVRDGRLETIAPRSSDRSQSDSLGSVSIGEVSIGARLADPHLTALPERDKVFCTMRFACYASSDRGATWRPIASLPPARDKADEVFKVVTDPYERAWYAVVKRFGERGGEKQWWTEVWRSADGGTSWSDVLEGQFVDPNAFRGPFFTPRDVWMQVAVTTTPGDWRIEMLRLPRDGERRLVQMEKPRPRVPKT